MIASERQAFVERFGVRECYAEHLASTMRHAFNSGEDLEPIVAALRRNCPHWFHSNKQWRKLTRSK
jgi:hypothetical protein